jgi:SNF family Na+-dependent transporter
LSHLNLLNCYLWGYLNTLGYAVPVDNKEALHHHIVDACQAMCNFPSICELMQQSVVRCVKACIESHGGHFEHLIKCTLPAINHKLNVSKCTLMWTFFLVLVCATHAQSFSTPFVYTLYILATEEFGISNEHGTEVVVYHDGF